MKSCYIHIPFCEHICSYCDFCKMFYNEKMVDRYLTELEKEISANYKGEVLETIYIGGGTPSCLSLRQLKRLFEIIDGLNKSEKLEFTIECNVENTSSEKLKLFREFGVNRLSFGVESGKEKFLKFLLRNNTREMVRRVIKEARELGFLNINVDLMYALPEQTLEDLEEDLNFIKSLEVEHISTYSLIIEEHTRLSIDKVKPIDEELDFSMYQLICRKMKEAGYSHYEISNFSKNGYFSRHNLCYWNNLCYYGFGLGASGYIGDRRYSNTRSINNYLVGNYISDEEILSKNDIIEYEVILNLRKKEGISLDDFFQKYQCRLNEKYQYDSLVKDHLLEEVDNHLFIAEDKWYLSNEIMVRLLEGEVKDE